MFLKCQNQKRLIAYTNCVVLLLCIVCNTLLNVITCAVFTRKAAGFQQSRVTHATLSSAQLSSALQFHLTLQLCETEYKRHLYTFIKLN